MASSEVSRVRLRTASDGSLAFQVRSLPIVGLAGGELLLCSFLLEVGSLQQRLEEECMTLRDDNRRLKAFAHAIAHDLKSPARNLAVCAGWVEKGLGADLDGETKENLGFLKSRAKMLMTRIDGLLAFATVKPLASSIDTIEVAPLLEEIVSAFGRRDQARVRVISPMPTVEFNRVELSRVFQHLLDNAIRFSSTDSGPIEVSWSKVESGDRFQVSDSGPGIRPQDRERIFEVYTKLKPSDDDLDHPGVGLSICQAIIEGRGGQLGVDSDGRTGSSFWFIIPRPSGP